MENRINEKTKVVTEKVRFAYVNVFEPRRINGGDARYSICLIIDKQSHKTIAEINAAIAEAKKEGLAIFGGSILEDLKLPLHDGDIERPNEEEFKNSLFLNAVSMNKPEIVDRKLRYIEDRSEVYSGCYGKASMFFTAFSRRGRCGIACRLLNLQKLKDGEPLYARSRAGEDFSPAEDDYTL